jgi:hypothetical protein
MNGEFIIENKVLKKYFGKDKEIVVPEYIEEIGPLAFRDCIELKSVHLPEGLKVIDLFAFEGCVNLEKINLPVSIEKIKTRAFRNCSSLANVVLPPNLKEIDTNVFYGCSSIKEINIPDKVKSLNDEVFFNCSALETVTLPKGLEFIGWSAFENCSSLKEIDIPDSVGYIGNYAFEGCFGDRAKQLKLEREMLLRPISLGYLFAEAIDDAETCACAAIYRGDRYWNERIDAYVQSRLIKFEMNFLNDVVMIICDRIDENTKKYDVERATGFLLRYGDFVSVDVVKKYYQTLYSIKSEYLKLLIEDTCVQNMLLDGRLCPQGEKLEKSICRAVEVIAKIDPSDAEIADELRKFIKKGVPYADFAGTSSPDTVIFVILEYLKWMTEITDDRWFDKDFIRSRISYSADTVVRQLDMASLQRYFEKITFLNDETIEKCILAYARYASPSQIEKLIHQKSCWRSSDDFSEKERKNVIRARGALMLSDTYEAIKELYYDNLLFYYFDIRDYDEYSTVINSVFSELGFIDRKKTYDLGESKVIVSVSDDLSVNIIDEGTGTKLVDIPQYKSNKFLCTTAKEEVDKLKAITNGVESHLFSCFLDGRRIESLSWASYLKSVPFISLAHLLVWRQNGKCFTVTEDGKTINSDGSEFPFVKNWKTTVTVSHPMDMTEDEIEEWKDYFKRNNLKQPFDQLGEPVYRADEIKEDRYKECMVRLDNLENAGKDGILILEGEGFRLRLTGFAMSYKIRYSYEIPDISDVVIDKILEQEKFSKYGNHIVHLLDGFTIKQRILKRYSISLCELDGYSEDKITELIDYASENNCVNSLAMLMNFKDKKFGRYGSAEEYSLE